MILKEIGLTKSLRKHLDNQLFAELAQLVEQRFRKAWVIGSIPMLGSISPIGEMDFLLTGSCQDLQAFPSNASPAVMPKAGSQPKRLKLSVRATRLGITVRRVRNLPHVIVE